MMKRLSYFIPNISVPMSLFSFQGDEIIVFAFLLLHIMFACESCADIVIHVFFSLLD